MYIQKNLVFLKGDRVKKLKDYIKAIRKENVRLLFNFILLAILFFPSILFIFMYCFMLFTHIFFYLMGAGTELSYQIILGIPFLYMGTVLFLFLSLNIIIEILSFIIKLILKRFI